MTLHVLYIHQSRFYFFFSSLRLINEKRERRRKKKEAEKIEEVTTETKTKTAIKTKRSLNSRWQDICILINIALFICFSEKNIYHYNKYVKLFMRYLKSIKIFVIVQKIASAKRIYMLLTLLIKQSHH